MITKLKPKLITFLYYLFRLFPINHNKVILSNYVGKGYGCNPKYIAEALMKTPEHWKLIWLTDHKKDGFPESIKIIQQDTIKAIFESATAGFWIDNQRKLPHHKKRKNQFFIETWHGGGGPMKKIGADNPQNTDNFPYYKTSLHMDKIVDIMISNSACCSKIYRSAFLYHGEILECGYPRNDILLEEWKCGRERAKVYEYYKLKKNIKTVLYAPTYRNKRTLDPYALDFSMLISALQERYSGSWKIIVRLHPSMLKKNLSFKTNKTLIDASTYDDMQELLAACDLLISDYSSVICEFALTKKPVFLFATDISEYAEERAFYWNYRELPFPIAENNKELKHNIVSFIDANYQQKLAAYMRQIGIFEKGHAAEHVVDWMNRKINSL